MKWLSSLFKRGKTQSGANVAGSQPNAQISDEEAPLEHTRTRKAVSEAEEADHIGREINGSEKSSQNSGRQNGALANISVKIKGIGAKFKRGTGDVVKSAGNNARGLKEKFAAKLDRNRKAHPQDEAPANQQERVSAPAKPPSPGRVVALKKEDGSNKNVGKTSLRDKSLSDENGPKSKGFLQRFRGNIEGKGRKISSIFGSLAKKFHNPFPDMAARAKKVLPLLSAKEHDEGGDGSLDFKRAVKINITKSIIFAVARWIYFIGVIALFHKLAMTYGESTHIAVACAIVFFIYPYYLYIFGKFLHWYIRVVRQEKYLVIQPFELAYIYIYNEVKATLESRWPWMPFRSWLSKVYLKMEGKDKWLWANVGVLLGMYVLGWILYMNFYEEIMLYSTGIYFRHFWQPFIWPFTVLFG